jgi:hypothetical protein
VGPEDGTVGDRWRKGTEDPKSFLQWRGWSRTWAKRGVSLMLSALCMEENMVQLVPKLQIILLGWLGAWNVTNSVSGFSFASLIILCSDCL